MHISVREAYSTRKEARQKTKVRLNNQFTIWRARVKHFSLSYFNSIWTHPWWHNASMSGLSLPGCRKTFFTPNFEASSSRAELFLGPTRRSMTSTFSESCQDSARGQTQRSQRGKRTATPKKRQRKDNA